jgi:hypothetical protein
MKWSDHPVAHLRKVAIAYKKELAIGAVSKMSKSDLIVLLDKHLTLGDDNKITIKGKYVPTKTLDVILQEPKQKKTKKEEAKKEEAKKEEAKKEEAKKEEEKKEEPKKEKAKEEQLPQFEEYSKNETYYDGDEFTYNGKIYKVKSGEEVSGIPPPNKKYYENLSRYYNMENIEKVSKEQYKKNKEKKDVEKIVKVMKKKKTKL